MFSSQEEMSVNGFENLVLQANGLAESISDYFVLIKPIMNTFLNYNNIEGFKNLCLYVIESLVCYGACLFIISKIYYKGAIGTTINSSRNSTNELDSITEKDFKRKSKRKSYLYKEFETMYRTPIFFLECLLMPILYPVAVFLILFGLIAFSNMVGYDLIAKMQEIATTTTGASLFVGVGQVFFMMNFSSIIAVSRESNNAIITKYIPLDLEKQFNMKTLLGFLINTVSTVLVTVFFYLCTNNWLYTILVFAILNLINIVGERFKLLIDLQNPQLNWDTEYTMMKQNTNVMYVLFYSLLMMGIIYVIGLISPNVMVLLVALLILMAVACRISSTYIKRKGYELFKKVH